MMYTMPKNLLSICVNFALATQQFVQIRVILCKTKRLMFSHQSFGGTTQNRTGDQGVAVPRLTAWLWYHVERLTRLELATSTLARWRSTR